MEIVKENSLPEKSAINTSRMVPYPIPNAFAWITGILFLVFLADAILPNEARRTLKNPMESPKTPLSDKSKDSISGIKIMTIPMIPKTAPAIIFFSIGAPRKIDPLAMFINTIEENKTATRPLVRYNSAT